MQSRPSMREPDPETLREFADSLADLAVAIERDIARLERNPLDRPVIANLFRSVHNIKGDAALCEVDMGVVVAHPVETLLSRLRSGEIAYSDLLGETILMAIDRLELFVKCMLAGSDRTHLRLDLMVAELDNVAACAPPQLETRCASFIELVTGIRPKRATQGNFATPPHLGGQTVEARDLAFFHSLAVQLEARSPQFSGRYRRLRELALATNSEAGTPVDPLQLEAAIYMHDVGMMFLPEPVWLKVGDLSEGDWSLLRMHPEFSAGLLERMPGWSEAVRMVREHHETPDGKGYPRGLLSHEICPGAKILALVDAFEAVMLKHTHRGHRGSMLRAVAEINACENQFSSDWIQPFNRIIRKKVQEIPQSPPA